MPRTVNPASITVGAGLAPQGTVEDNSLRYPQRDTDSLRAHLLDPNKAHMASAIGIVDAGGFYASDDVEGALQEIGAGGSAGRHNGLVIGGTFTSGPGLLTLDTPTLVLIGGVAASFGGATVVLPPSVTRYVWIDPTTSTLTASAALPPVSSEPILIAKVTTDAGANVTASQDARFFVANLDRKVDYTLRSDGSPVNDASEACFVTLDAALFWLENYVSTGQERKALVLVRGSHLIASTVIVPTGIPNIEFRGEGAASFATGAALAPMFDVSGTTGVTFTGLSFLCNHAASTAIRTNNAALACSNVTVQNCRFLTGGAAWSSGVVLDQATPAPQTGHRVLNCELTASATAIQIDRAVDCVVRDCVVTGDNTVGSIGVVLARIGPAGATCLVENVRVTGGFDFPFDIGTFTTTLRKCVSVGGGALVRGAGAVVDGCAFTGITDTTAGLSVLPTALGAVVSATTVTSTTVWAVGDNPTGIGVAADGAVVTGCFVSGFYNTAGNNGAGVRLVGSSNNKVVSTDFSDCHTGVEVLVGATGSTVEGCTIAARVRGVYSDSNAAGTRVSSTNITLDNTTGLHGIVLEGSGASALGCQVTTGRAFNTYAVGEVPAGVLCGANAGSGPFTIEGCTFTNLYDSTAQAGGGVVHTGGVQGLTVANCTFNNGGINSSSASNLNTVLVTGCVFGATIPNLLRMGVEFVIGGGGAVLDANVSDCAFKFGTSDTGFAVSVQANAVNRFVIADCTYSAVSAPGGVERFVNVSASTGVGVVIEGNTVNFPSANTFGPLFVQGVDSLVVANNNFMSAAASTGTVLTTNAKVVTYTGNTSVGMNGLALSDSGGTLPTLEATGNTIDGSSVTAAVGVRLISANAALTLSNMSLTSNTIRACLDAVVLTNTLNTLDVSGLTFTGNTVSACRNGLTTDADNYDNFLVTNNNFGVRNYAVYQSNTASTGNTVKVDGNLITQAAFVAPAVSLGLVLLAGASINGASVSRNQFDHTGAVSAIAMVFSGDGPEDISIDENIVRNEVASAAAAIECKFVVTNVGAPQINNVSLSRNKVNHFGGGFAAVRLALTGSTGFNVFRNFHLDDNHVVVDQNDPLNSGVEFQCTGSGAGTPGLRGVSMCRNTVLAFGPSVRLFTTGAASVEGVLLCDNTALAGNALSGGAVQFSCTYVGGIPATAAVNNVSLCRNLVTTTDSNYAVRVVCAAPMTNLSVDDNAIQQVGDAGNPVVGSGNISILLNNVVGYPTRDAASGVSVCRNKVTGINALANYGEAAILLTSAAGLVTEGKNITVDDNEVYNHVGDAIKVQFGYNSIQNVSVSGNKVRSVEGKAIVIERADALNGLSVSNNVIQNALSAGGSAGDGTIEVDLVSGNGFLFSGNRLGVTSRRGFFVDGGSATGSLEGVTFTGNVVDFSNGTGAAEEGFYLFWEHNLVNVAVTGNTIRAADTGIYIDGGLASSTASISTVYRVAVTGNAVSADNYGVWVSNHTVDSGLGTSHLKGVTVTGNTVTAISSGGAMTYGVLVDTVFGDLEHITVANNTVDMGTASTGVGIAVDSNDAIPTGVSVLDNSVVYGHRGIYILGNGNRFSDLSVCRNRVRELGSVGIHVAGMDSLRNVAVDDNTVENVQSFLGITGYGIFLYDPSIQQDSRNVSVSGNSVNSTQNSGIWVQLLRDSGTPGVFNLSVCHNRVTNWNEGTAYATVPIPAIVVLLCSNVADPHPLFNFNFSHNLCENVVDNYVKGFTLTLDEKTRQVVFAHNQVLLDNQTNTGAMDWTFTNTGADIPKDFSFTGNQFRNTNGAVPSYTGATGDFAVFQGNIGSAANFWTTFATNWTNTLPAVINNQNFDNGT